MGTVLIINTTLATVLMKEVIFFAKVYFNGNLEYRLFWDDFGFVYGAVNCILIK